MTTIRLLSLLVCWLFGTLLMWRVRALPAARRRGELEPSAAGELSVIIPARNEERRLAPLLRSLAAQEPRPREVLVVDDGSTDGTAELAVSLGARVVAGEPLPAGWSGKSWACWQGARASGGGLLLFLDADTWLMPGALSKLLTAYESQGSGVLSVQPYHAVRAFYEHLSAFFNIVLMASTNAFTILGDRIAPSAAFGPCVLCRRDEYERVGGHQVVRDDVLEDIGLGQAFSRAGLPARAYAGRGAIAFRMYPGGIRELLEGWSKGFGGGAFKVNLLYALLTAAWVYGCFGAFSQPLRALAGGQAPWLGVGLYALYAAQVGWMLTRIGSFRWWCAAAYPLALVFFVLVMLRSLVMIYILRRVSWRGRQVPTGHKGEA